MRNYNDLNKNYQSGDLDINGEHIDSLAGCPQHITGVFNCRYNNLSSLVGGPETVDGNYICRINNLTSLSGCASHIGGSLFIANNPITSLVGIHKIIKSCSRIFFDDSNITEGGIGILLIANLSGFSNNDEQFRIITKYLGTGTKGMMECRKELIARGYANYAKL